MDINDGRFSMNGGCGYVLKPFVMRDPVSVDDCWNVVEQSTSTCEESRLQFPHYFTLQSASAYCENSI